MHYLTYLLSPHSRFVAAHICILIIVCIAFTPVIALGGEATLAGEKAHAEEFVTLSADMAKASGIQTMEVASGPLDLLATVYGDVTTDPASLSHIRARFDGVISAVKVNLGDNVSLGDTLATVESNESLKRYKITSPFTGIVIARHANTGELSNGQILFSIVNYDEVWVQLKVFPQQQALIKTGQKVLLSHSGLQQYSIINHIIPSAEGKPYTLAFIKLSNKDGQWPVGSLVMGQITITTSNFTQLIPKTAVQVFEGKSVVFVQQDNNYHPRSVLLGAADNFNIEVVKGVRPGERIVSQNSYLLKAELEKSEAGHAH
jgi:cobalt-zinc-cadmium efflux system membrane fusion protein